jgi:hypothetical protein
MKEIRENDRFVSSSVLEISKAKRITDGVEAAQDYLFEQICFDKKFDPVEVRKQNKKRIREYVIIRQVSMTLNRLWLGSSLSVSGKPFSKDHATVLHSIKTVKNLKDTDKNFREDWNKYLMDIKFPVIK